MLWLLLAALALSLAGIIIVGNYQIWTPVHFAFPAAAAADYDGAASTAVSGAIGLSTGPRDLLYVRICPHDTWTAGNVLRFFVTDGSIKTWIGDYPMPAPVVKSPGGRWRDLPHFYPNGGPVPFRGTSYQLYVSEEKSDTIKGVAMFGDYQA